MTFALSLALGCALSRMLVGMYWEHRDTGMDEIAAAVLVLALVVDRAFKARRAP